MKASIFVYPNPLAGDRFSLQLDNKPKGAYIVRLINPAGQAVFSKTINHEGGSATESIQLPLQLAKGIYRVAVKDKKNQTELIALVLN